jgi:ribosomal-protein-alanine N-acetyltransferase
MGRLVVRSMREGDVEQVLAIERDSFVSPWTAENFRYEILRNRHAVNYVMERDGRLLGYACVWFIGREMKINNIAIDRAERRAGLGERLLRGLLRRAAELGCLKAELEVRVSNRAARSLYRKLGFREVGRRRNYYQREREDALLLATEIAPENGD